MQTSRALATALNAVQTGHSYGDIMLNLKAQEAKQVCFFFIGLDYILILVTLLFFPLLNFVCFLLYLILKFKLQNQMSGWCAFIDYCV